MSELLQTALIAGGVSVIVTALSLVAAWLRGRRGEKREDEKSAFEQAMVMLETLRRKVEELDKVLAAERASHSDTIRTLRKQAMRLEGLEAQASSQDEMIAALRRENRELRKELEAYTNSKEANHGV
jgi:chromosome segregation ATPase